MWSVNTEHRHLLSAKFACLNIEKLLVFAHVPTERKTSHKKVSYRCSLCTNPYPCLRLLVVRITKSNGHEAKKYLREWNLSFLGVVMKNWFMSNVDSLTHSALCWCVCVCVCLVQRAGRTKWKLFISNYITTLRTEHTLFYNYITLYVFCQISLTESNLLCLTVVTSDAHLTFIFFFCEKRNRTKQTSALERKKPW